MALFSTEFEYSSRAHGTLSNLPTENKIPLNGPSGLKGRGQWISSWNHLGKSPTKLSYSIITNGYHFMPGLTVKVNMPWQTSWCRWFTSTYYKDLPSGYACLFCNPGLQCLVNMPAILDSQAHLCYRLMSTNKPPPWFRRKRWPCCESRGARNFEKSSLDLRNLHRIGGKKVDTVTFAFVKYVNPTLSCSCLGGGILDSVGCSNPKELTV